MPGAIAIFLSADQLRVGDIVIFDSDVPHRGTAYLHGSNVCMHMYLDVREVRRVRNPRAEGSFTLVRQAVGFKYASQCEPNVNHIQELHVERVLVASECNTYIHKLTSSRYEPRDPR